MSKRDLNDFTGYDKIGLEEQKNFFCFIFFFRSFYLAFNSKTVKSNQTKINHFIAQTRYNGPQMNTHDAPRRKSVPI